jgi:hypothetical protein
MIASVTSDCLEQRAFRLDTIRLNNGSIGYVEAPQIVIEDTSITIIGEFALSIRWTGGSAQLVEGSPGGGFRIVGGQIRPFSLPRANAPLLDLRAWSAKSSGVRAVWRESSDNGYQQIVFGRLEGERWVGGATSIRNVSPDSWHTTTLSNVVALGSDRIVIAIPPLYSRNAKATLLRLTDTSARAIIVDSMTGIYPMLGLGEEGDILLTFVARPEAAQQAVFVRRSSDGGLSWEPAVRVSPSNAASAHWPEIHRLSGDTLAVTWTTFDRFLSLAVSVDNGRTWSLKRRYESTSNVTQYRALAHRGNLFVALIDDPTPEAQVRFGALRVIRWSSSGWEDLSLPFAAPAFGTPSVAVSGETLRVVWGAPMGASADKPASFILALPLGCRSD